MMRRATDVTTGIVLSACVYVASHIKEKGVVELKGNAGRIIVGKNHQHPLYSPERLIDLMANAGIGVEYQENAFPAIWTKFFFIASFGLVFARYNQSIGQVEQDPLLHKRAERTMHEIAAIARQKAVALPVDMIDQTFQKARSFPFHTPTSLQLDVHSGKAHTELVLFAGAIVAYGIVLGISTEETKMIQGEIEEMLAKE